jgi:predicted RNA binding protein YcfA (HicA-like mRNA interferase family)
VSRIPRISGQECIKALKKVGFYQKRRESSHVILRRDEPFAQVVVPEHQELATGTLRAIIRDADLSVEEFIALL